MALLDCHPAHIGDVSAGDKDVARFDTKSASPAIRTRRVSSIAAQKDANVELVFLCFEIVEEVAYPVQYKVELLAGQFADRSIERDSLSTGRLLELIEIDAVSRFGPRFDSALVQRKIAVRKHQIQIQVNRIAESLTSRARAERIVEGEQAWLGIFIANIAGLAFKRFAEASPLTS